MTPPSRRLLCTIACALSALAGSAAPAVAAPATVATAEAEQGTLSGWSIRSLADATATGGASVRYDWNGAVQLKVQLPADADTITVRARGDQCAGAPEYSLTVDNVPVGTTTPVSTTGWSDSSASVPLVAGTHTLEVRYSNDYASYWTNPCDRNLFLDSVTFSASGAAAAPGGNAAIPAGFVHQSGTQLLDGANRPLRLRGVNVGGWLLWEGWVFGRGFDYVGETAMMRNLTSLVGAAQAEQFRTDVRTNFVTAADFHAMSGYGLNVARVPFGSRLLEDDAQPYVYKPSGWDVLDRTIAAAKRENVYLVLDLQAAPCSQSYSFTSDYVGPDFLWFSTKCQDRTVALWKAIAARYADQNVIAGYDLLNETVTTDANLLGLYRKATAAIREVDRNHALIYEGNAVAQTFDFMPSALDANAILSVHDYTMTTPGDVISRTPRYVASAKRLNAPVWVGEFGQAGLDTLKKYVTTFDAEPTIAGWAQWTWKQSPGLPALQTIQHTAASKKLIDFIDDASRPRPTAAEAAQGMSDFVRAIRFESTTYDARLRPVLTGR